MWLLAIELFEVITIRVVDALQQLIDRLNCLKGSAVSVHIRAQGSNLRVVLELLRLWVPVLMVQVGPSLRPQLVEVLHHILRNNLADGDGPAISRQLATSVVDSLLTCPQNRRTPGSP